MADPKNEAAFERGRETAKNGTFIDDLAYGIARPVGTDEDKSYCEGYEEGVKERYEPSSEDTSSDDD